MVRRTIVQFTTCVKGRDLQANKRDSKEGFAPPRLTKNSRCYGISNAQGIVLNTGFAERQAHSRHRAADVVLRANGVLWFSAGIS